MQLLSLSMLGALLLGCARQGEDGPPEPAWSSEEASVTLQMNSGREVVNPSDSQLREALAGLDVQRDGDGFAILERSQMTYLQVSGDSRIGFDMEYQEGDTDHHYRATRDDLSLEEVVDALAAYSDGRAEWWKTQDWEKISW